LTANEQIKAEREGWQRAQKGTFTRWLNFQLRDQAGVEPIGDLQEDLKDGTALCALVAKFQGKPLPRRVWRDLDLPKDKFKALENLTIFLDAFKELLPGGSDLSNIGPSDIYDGNYTLVMGLIWLMILRVQCDVVDLEDAAGGDAAKSSSGSRLDELRDDGAANQGNGRRRGSRAPRPRTLAFAKENILEWVRGRCAPYGIDVNDFSHSFESGKAFQALAASVDESYNFAREATADPKQNMESAFDHFDSLGVPKLLSSDDMVACSPDARSVMTYLAVLHDQFKDRPLVRPDSSAAAAAASSSGVGDNGNSDSDDDDDDDDDDELDLHFTLKGEGLQRVVVGERAQFSVHVCDKSNNMAVLPSGDKLAVAIEYVDGRTLVFSQRSLADGGSSFDFVATRAIGDITVHLWYEETPVTSVAVPVEEARGAGSSPGATMTLGGDDVEHGIVVGESVEFLVRVDGVADPKIELLRVIVEGPSGQVPVSVTANGDGTFLARYVPVEVGNHDVSAFYDGGAAKAQRTAAAVAERVAEPRGGLSLHGKEYKTYVTVGEPAQFNVKVADASGRPVQPSAAQAAEFGAEITDPFGRRVPTNVTPQADGYRVDYTPMQEGEYQIALVNGGTRQQLDPVYARQPGAEFAHLGDSELARVKVGEPARFLVAMHDSDGAAVEVRSDGTRVQVVDPAGTRVPYQMDDDGVVTYMPDMPGRYHIAVVHEGVRSPMQPVLAVNPDPVFRHAPSPRVLVGRSASFTVALHDPDGQLVEAAPGQLEIFVEGPQGRVPTVVSLDDDGYRVEYIPDTEGQFQISVVHNNKKTCVTPVDAVAMTVGREVEVGEPCQFSFQIRNPDGSSVDPNSSDLAVSIRGPDGSAVPANVELDDDACSVTFLPDNEGLYEFTCHFGGKDNPMPSIFAGEPQSAGAAASSAAQDPRASRRGWGRSARMTRAGSIGGGDARRRRPGAGGAASSGPVVALTPLPQLKGHVVRVWLAEHPLEVFLQVPNSFRTFPLDRMMTAEQLRAAMLRSLFNGLPSNRLAAAQRLAVDHAYCICDVPRFGGEDAVRRLRRDENIAAVVTNMRMREQQLHALSVVSKRGDKSLHKKMQKRLERGSGVITTENAKFLATQAHRVYVTVHSASDLVRVGDVECSVLINVQKMRTSTVRFTAAPVFDERLTFGVNSLSGVKMQVRLYDPARPRDERALLGTVEVPIDQLLVVPTWERRFPLTGRPGLPVSGAIHMTLEYAPSTAAALPVEKLTEKQLDVFMRSQPQRLISHVLEVAGLDEAVGASDVHAELAYNHQRPRTTALQKAQLVGWPGEQLVVGISELAEPSAHVAIFKAGRPLAVAPIDLSRVEPDHRMEGWFPLCAPAAVAGQAPRPLGPTCRVKVAVEHHTEGLWSTETAGRLYFRPAPKIYLEVSVNYPRLRVKLGDTLPISVKVRDIALGRVLSDDLRGGELDVHIAQPDGQLVVLPAHKNFPDGDTVGHFQIDFTPTALGNYQSMLKYNDQLMQHRTCRIRVKRRRRPITVEVKKGNIVSNAR
jgi:Calponin homology (CH) domain/Filamin/ABP280 repeat/C2 domain